MPAFIDPHEDYGRRCACTSPRPITRNTSTIYLDALAPGLPARRQARGQLIPSNVYYEVTAEKPLWAARHRIPALLDDRSHTKAPQLDAEGKPVLDKVTGDPICAGFMNGSLGVVTKPHPKGAWMRFDDGAEEVITTADLEKLTHGWAISVHKAQGSAFRRVINPVVRSKLLDRTMLYSAITRGIETVVLVGDIDLINEIIEAAPASLARDSALRFSVD